jgi:putative heme transporter
MSPRTRRVLQTVIGLGLAAAMLIWGLPYFAKTSWTDIWTVIRTIPLSHALGFQALMLLGLWSYTFTFTGSLHGLSHGKALIVNLCGSSVSNLLPGGGAVGLAATYAICRSWGFSRRNTSTSVIVTGVWNVMARIALPVVAIAALWFGGVTLPPALTDLAVAGMFTGLGILAAFIAIMASERAAQAIGRWLDKLLVPLLRKRRAAKAKAEAEAGRVKPPMSIEELVTDLRARINDVVGSGWISMTLGMVGFFGAYYVLFVLIMRGTGVTLSLNLLFAAFAIGRLLTAVGITPGGMGITETAT